MGIPISPPPLKDPPIITEKPITQQQQDQFQTNTLGELNQDQLTNSDADSKSSSDSSSVNSASQQNININSNSNRISYGTFHMPEKSIHLNGFVDQRGNFGGTFTLNIPLGGRSRKLINRSLQTRTLLDQLELEKQYASVCSSIDKQGYVVNPESTELGLLSRCSTNIVARQSPKSTNVNNDFEKLRQENAELKAIVQELLIKINNNNTVRGSY